MTEITEDAAEGGTTNCDLTVTLVAPGILSLSEMMNVGAPASRFAGGITDVKFSVTGTGRDIEVERVKSTAGPNFPGPNVVIKEKMAKLLFATTLLWIENTIEFKPTP